MMNEGSLKLRESLHCIQVVFSILAGQGQVLTLDPTSFYQYLYANFYNISGGINKSVALLLYKIFLFVHTHSCMPLHTVYI